jgi:radical SAM protein with 4Fe4S-binding SPASM domain
LPKLLKNQSTSMKNGNYYFRPEWTCGRYHKESQSAIYYNLIEGMSYFFEDASADVVGAILARGRNGKFTAEDISEASGVPEEALDSFLQQLLQMGLVQLGQAGGDGKVQQGQAGEDGHVQQGEAGGDGKVQQGVAGEDDGPMQGAEGMQRVALDREKVAEYRRAVAEYRRNSLALQVKTTRDMLPLAVTNAEAAYTDRTDGLTSVMFELTYNCSERCIHCYNMGATRNDAEVSHRGDLSGLSLDDYKRIIDELYAEGLIKVCLSGGDPFSNPLAWDILDYLYDKDIAIDIFTNGQRIYDKAEKLAGYYPRTVGISIYSGEPDVHDYVTRVKGSFEKSVKAVEALSELSVPLTLKCCIMRPNVKSYRQVMDIAKKYGAVVQYEMNITDSVDGDMCARNLRLTPELLEIVLRDDNTKMYVGKEAPNYGGQERVRTEGVCGAAEHTFCITPDGKVIPCCSFHMELGSLKESSLREILEKSKTLKWWRSVTLEQYEECGKYDYCAYCNLCPGNNYANRQDALKAGENNCYMAKVRHSLAVRMMAGYDPLGGRSLAEALASLPDYVPTALKRESSRS